MAQTRNKTSRSVHLKYCLAVALLGMALIGYNPVAAEVKQSKDDQGNVRITNPGKAEPGKAGTKPQPGRKSPEPPPEAIPSPQEETPRPEPITAPPPMEEPPPEPFFAPFQEIWPPSEQAAAPPAEEAEWTPVIILPEGVTVESEDSQEGGGPAVEEQAPPKGGRSPGRSGGGGGAGRGRGRR